MVFLTVLQNAALMVAYLICGYVLVKANKMETPHARSLSGLLVYVCGPCLVLNSFQEMEYSMEMLRSAGVAFALGLVMMAAFFGLVFLLLRRRQEDARMRVLTLAAVVGNTGFYGVPLAKALFPALTQAAGWCMMYTAAMNVVIFTAGVFMITRERKYISLKSAIINPTSLMVIFALLLYVLKVHIPDVVENKVALIGNMSTPLCMVMLGMRLASMDLKQMFLQPFAYAACGLKLVAFPLFTLLCLSLIPGLDAGLKNVLYVASCAPCAVMVLSIAELHNVSQKLAANVVLLSTLVSVVVLPLMALLI